MAKNKSTEAIYKLERLRRTSIRKKERLEKYKNRIENKNRRHAPGDHWRDFTSPTGYSQVCDYEGTCQWPCNGDC